MANVDASLLEIALLPSPERVATVGVGKSKNGPLLMLTRLHRGEQRRQ